MRTWILPSLRHQHDLSPLTLVTSKQLAGRTGQLCFASCGCVSTLGPFAQTRRDWRKKMRRTDRANRRRHLLEAGTRRGDSADHATVYDPKGCLTLRLDGGSAGGLVVELHWDRFRNGGLGGHACCADFEPRFTSQGCSKACAEAVPKCFDSHRRRYASGLRRSECRRREQKSRRADDPRGAK